MKRETINNAVVFCLLVLFGVVSRFVLETPNFKPVAAIALFAGFYFVRIHVAVMVPLLVLAISNVWLDGYGYVGVMLAVYGALMFPIVFRYVLRNNLSTIRLANCAMASSLFLFVTTNFAMWYFGSLYPHTTLGLWECYVMAIPFYQWTLCGDLTFTAVLFGTYVLACRWSAVPVPVKT